MYVSELNKKIPKALCEEIFWRTNNGMKLSSSVILPQYTNHFNQLIMGILKIIFRIWDKLHSTF